MHYITRYLYTRFRSNIVGELGEPPYNTVCDRDFPVQAQSLNKSLLFIQVSGFVSESYAHRIGKVRAQTQ